MTLFFVVFENIRISTSELKWFLKLVVKFQDSLIWKYNEYVFYPRKRTGSKSRHSSVKRFVYRKEKWLLAYNSLPYYHKLTILKQQIIQNLETMMQSEYNVNYKPLRLYILLSTEDISLFENNQ